MTTAVCVKCGAFKHGALVPCPGCGHHPSTPRDQAEHLVLTDSFRGTGELTAISERIKAGLPLEFDEAQLKVIEEEIPKLQGWKAEGCVTCVVLAAIAGLAGILLYLAAWIVAG